MPLPKLLARINKHVFNRFELKRGNYPVLHVVGRSSGRTYLVPLEAHATDDGYLFILIYGSGSDWVRNVMAAGSAKLGVDDELKALGSPKLIGEEEAWKLVPPDTKRPPDFANVDEYLRMDFV